MIAAQCDGTRIGRIRLARIADASGDSLRNMLQETVDPGTVILTDGWKGYANIESLGYIHKIVSSAPNEVGEDMLPLCHSVASLLKRWMLGIHQGAISHEHLDYYLDEFTFWFNRRTSCHYGNLFYRLVQQAVAVVPVPYKDMVKHTRGRRPANHNL